MACRAHYAPVLQLETLSNQYLLIIELSLYYNISSLRHLRYEYFRSTIFSCMSLLGGK